MAIVEDEAFDAVLSTDLDADVHSTALHANAQRLAATSSSSALPASLSPSVSPMPLEDDKLMDEYEPLIMSFYSYKSALSPQEGYPWFYYLQHSCVWAYFFVFFAYNWSFYLLVSYLPKFLTTVLGFTMAQAGQVGLFAYLGLYCTILVGGRVNGLFIQKGYDASLVRKIGVSMGFIPAIVLLYSVTLPNLALTSTQISYCLLLAITSTGFAQSSFAPNPMDMAPKSPAFIASLGNMIGTLPGFLSSIFTGYILENIGHCTAIPDDPALFKTTGATKFKTLLAPLINDNTVSEDCYFSWMVIFRVCVGLYFLGWLAWIFLAKAKPLPVRRSTISAAAPAP